jgi:antitoxin ParD1/3/4
MSKTYKPGPETDRIIARQVERGHFADADAVVRAGVRLLEDSEIDVDALRELIDEGDADIAAGRVHGFAGADTLAADIVARGEARSKQRR